MKESVQQPSAPGDLLGLEFRALRIIQYEGPRDIADPRSRFLLCEDGLEDPDAEVLLLESRNQLPKEVLPYDYWYTWYVFEHGADRYLGRLTRPCRELMAQYLTPVDFVLHDIMLITNVIWR